MAILTTDLKSKFKEHLFKSDVRLLDTENVLSIDDLIEKAEIMQLSTNDVDTEKMWFDEDLSFHYETNDGEKIADMTFWSFSQLCSAIGINTGYIQQCVSNHEVALAVQNLNTWLIKEDRRKLRKIKEYIDLNSGTSIIRGIVSPKFSSVEPTAVFKTLKESLSDGLHIESSFFDYERMNLRIVSDFDNEKGSIKQKLKDYGEVGAGLFGGVVINNSEVGQSALDISYIMYRLACTNGMIARNKAFPIFSKRHLGLNIDDFQSALKNINERLLEYNEIMSNQIIKALDAKLTEKETDRLFEQIKKDAQLTKVDVEKIKVMREMKYKNFGGIWGITSAMTDVAHEYDIDKREQLEKIAHRVLMSADKYQ